MATELTLDASLGFWLSWHLSAYPWGHNISCYVVVSPYKQPSFLKVLSQEGIVRALKCNVEIDTKKEPKSVFLDKMEVGVDVPLI